jgi:putative GTP pyrophosphokinase
LESGPFIYSRDQWKPIHDFVIGTWDTHEQPIAYVRKGDPPKQIELMQKSGCKIEYHEFGYRSVHYLIKCQPDRNVHIVELQVRTVFEEGWSEIDHLVRYPNRSQDERLKEFLVLFNTLAGNADEMGSFIKNLATSLLIDAGAIEEMKKQLEDKERELRETVAKLNITKQEKANLEAKINEVTRKEHILSEWTGEFKNTLSTFGVSSIAGTRVVPGTFKIFRKCSRCGKQYLSSPLEELQSICPDCLNEK